MKIGKLNMHCGNCNVIDFCGDPYGYCLCYDARFADMEESTYKQIAENCKLVPHDSCCGCDMEYCDGCDKDSERRDCMCEQFADYVAGQLTFNG